MILKVKPRNILEMTEKSYYETSVTNGGFGMHYPEAPNVKIFKILRRNLHEITYEQ